HHIQSLTSVSHNAYITCITGLLKNTTQEIHVKRIGRVLNNQIDRSRQSALRRQARWVTSISHFLGHLHNFFDRLKIASVRVSESTRTRRRGKTHRLCNLFECHSLIVRFAAQAGALSPMCLWEARPILYGYSVTSWQFLAISWQ